MSFIDVDTLVCECIAKTTKMVISVEEEYQSVYSVKKDQINGEMLFLYCWDDLWRQIFQEGIIFALA